MGRKPRASSQLIRHKPTKEQYDYILIVCEGEKSEPNYLKSIQKDYQLSSANVVILGEECGSAPSSVVRFAKEQAMLDDYDKVFCVFDRDQHRSFNSAIGQIHDMNNTGKPEFFSITSIPCFEIWVLLHYRYTTAKFTPTNGSICKSVITEVKTFLPAYEKGYRSLYDDLKDLLNQALANNETLGRYGERTGDINPSTKMGELVRYLINLKN